MADLKCKLCGGRHKARADKFPLILYGDRNVIDQITKRVVGKMKVIIGYACRKCKSKYDAYKHMQTKKGYRQWIRES